MTTLTFTTDRKLQRHMILPQIFILILQHSEGLKWLSADYIQLPLGELQFLTWCVMTLRCTTSILHILCYIVSCDISWFFSLELAAFLFYLYRLCCVIHRDSFVFASVRKILISLLLNQNTALKMHSELQVLMMLGLQTLEDMLRKWLLGVSETSYWTPEY